jgi:hypothetical protein
MLHQKIAIPAYFHSDSDADWDTAMSARVLLKIVVFNPASGPGYTTPFLAGGQEHLNFKGRITQMHNIGVNIRANVLGYVTTNRRDSRPGDTVQREHRFTVDPATGVVTTRNSDGDVHETGWTKGFGPIQVRSDGTLPGGLAIETDYFWINVSPQTGQFATSKANAIADVGIDHFTSAGDPPNNNKIHGMGLSRTLKNIANVKFEIDEYYARWPDIDGMFFDEMNDVGDADDKKYYKDIFDHVKTKGGNALVVQNPGRKFPELEEKEMFDVADTFITLRGQAQVTPATSPTHG